MSGPWLERGPLGGYVDGYRAWLVARGYTPSTVRMQVMMLGRLGRWMASEGVDVERLEGAVIESFWASRRSAGLSRGPGSFVSLLRSWARRVSSHRRLMGRGSHRLMG